MGLAKPKNIRKRFLEKTADIIINYQFIVFILIVISIVVSIILSLRLRIETDVTGLLPKNSKTAQIFQQALKDFGAFDFTLAVIESENPDQQSILTKAAEAFSQELANPEFIETIDYRLDKELYSMLNENVEKLMVSLIAKEDFADINSRLEPEKLDKQLQQLKSRLISVQSPKARKLLLEDPLDLSLVVRKRLTNSHGPIKLNLSSGFFLSKDNNMILIVIKPSRPSSDIIFAFNYIKHLNKAKESFFTDNPELSKGLSIDFAGSHIEALNDSQLVKKDFKLTMISSFFMVLILIVGVYRRFDSVIFLGIPLGIGVVWSIGLASILVGRLTIVTIAFAAILIGLGIDYAIHIYGRFIEEMVVEHDVKKAIKITLMETGEGIFAGAFTTTAPFFCMLLTSFNGFKELGIITGIGILVCMFAIFFTLTPLLIMRTSKDKGRVEPKHYSKFYYDKVYDFVEKFPKSIIVVEILITIFLGYYATKLTFEEDLRTLKQPSQSYLALRKKMSDKYELPSNQIIAIVTGASVQDALEKNDTLYSNINASSSKFPIHAVESLRIFLPSIKTQQESRNFIKSIDSETLKKNISELSPKHGLSGQAFEPFFTRLEKMKKIAEEGEFLDTQTIKSDMFKRALEKFMVKTDKGYRIVTHIYPKAGEWRNSVPQDFLDTISIGAGEVDYTGVAIISDSLRSIVKIDFKRVIFIVLVCVFILIFLHFKNIAHTLIAMLPVIFGSLWVLGFMQLFNIKLNAVNIVVIPMILGEGVASGIYLIQRYREKEKFCIKTALENTGRAITMCSLTTIFGFGSLITAHFRGMREMGAISVFGVAFCLIITITLLPSIIILLQKKTAILPKNNLDKENEKI